MSELIRKLNEQLPDSEKINFNELDKLSKEDNLSLKSIPKSFLNEDQNTGLKTILDWLYTYRGSRNEDAFFSLRGSAGTGKTTLIGELLKAIDKSKYSSGSICICAPTHKAKKVILSKTKWHNGETLQSLLGLKLDVNLDDFDPNKPEFTQSGNRKIQDYKIVIIDESSMINTKLYQLLVETCKGTMILFVGDHVQLNPVKEYNISLALTNPIHSYTLTIPARQKIGNPLLDLLNIIREDIEKGTSVYLDILKGMPININSEGEGYEMTKDSSKFAESLKELFKSEEFLADKDHCRFIAWTNEAITMTNRYIRNKIFEFKNTVEEGELLLSYRTVLLDEEISMTNSDDYVVESVEPYEVSTYTRIINTLRVEMKSIDTDSSTSILLLDREESNYGNYIGIYDEHLIEARANRTWVKKFYPFKNYIIVPDKIEYKRQYSDNSVSDFSVSLIMLEKNNKVPKNDKETINKDIDYGYGITAHKSQGSTYNTVFVNYKDISQIVQFARPEEKHLAEAMKKRLLYVALSRASRKAYIIM